MEPLLRIPALLQQSFIALHTVPLKRRLAAFLLQLTSSVSGRYGLGNIAVSSLKLALDCNTQNSLCIERNLFVLLLRYHIESPIKDRLALSLVESENVADACLERITYLRNPQIKPISIESITALLRSDYVPLKLSLQDSKFQAIDFPLFERFSDALFNAENVIKDPLELMLSNERSECCPGGMYSCII